MHVVGDDVTSLRRRPARSPSRTRLALAAVLVLIAVVTGGVWWALAASAVVPVIVGPCAMCRRSADVEFEDGDDSAGEFASESDTSTMVEPS